MNRSGAPANCWLLCLIYVCYLLNHIACAAVDGKIPLFALTGITPDISIILLFTFYQPVFYAIHDQHFPSESEEWAAYWVGSGEHCGDAMTHKLLDHETQKIIYRSAVRPQKSSTPNHGLAPHGGEVSTSSDPSEAKISYGSPLGTSEGYSLKQKSSSGPEMMRIHLDPSLCLLLTQKTSLEGHSFCLLKKMVKGIEPRLPEKLCKLVTKKMSTE